MVVRKGGSRAKTRHLMQKKESGKFSLRKYFSTYAVGDKVKLMADPAYQRALFHLRFYGKNAIVRAKRGNCYEVTIKDGSKTKMFIVHPMHLRKL